MLSDWNEDLSVYKLQRRNTPSLSRTESFSSSREGFEEVDVDVVTNFAFHINLEGVGISVINRRLQELAYASFRGLALSYIDSTTAQSIKLECKWIQIDNQLFGGIFPIFLYPAVIPRDSKELEIHPNLSASVILLKDQGEQLCRPPL